MNQDRVLLALGIISGRITSLSEQQYKLLGLSWLNRACHSRDTYRLKAEQIIWMALFEAKE